MSSATTFPQVDVTLCPLCGASHGRYAYRGYYLKCASCRVAFRPEKQARPEQPLDEYWETEFWTEEEIEKRKQREPVFRHAFELLQQATRNRPLPNGGSVLDIGCGIGTFLAICRESGWQVTGVEPSAIACQVAQREYGLDLINEPFSSALFPRQTFDAIFAAQVLHHLPDPLAFITGVDHALAPGGILMLRTPNLIPLEPSLLMQRLLRREENFFCGPARFVFHPHTLTLLLQRLGYYDITFVNSRPYLEKPASGTSALDPRRHLIAAVKLATYGAVEAVHKLSNGRATLGPSIFVIARKG